MQDEYVGDIGDYVKYSLLRAFADGDPKLRIGVNWYLTHRDQVDDPDDYAGQITSYLGQPKIWRELDPDVFDGLRSVTLDEKGAVRTLAGGRTVAAVQGLKFWPAGTSFVPVRIAWDATPAVPWEGRRDLRESWHKAALKELAGADVVFLDPDNGVRVAGLYGRKGPKYAAPDEVGGYVNAKQAVVLYAHSSRVDTAETLAARVDRLVTGGGASRTPRFAVIVFHGRNGRGFYVTGGTERVAQLRERAQRWLGRRRDGFGDWTIWTPPTTA